MSPIHRKRIFTWILLFVLLLQLPAGAVDSWHPDGLYHKTLAILGDSYCAGYGLDAGELSWPQLIAEEYDLEYLDFAISGSTLAEGDAGRDPMVQRAASLPDLPMDVIVIQGGSNDWSRAIPLGDHRSRQRDTVLGALNVILDTLERTHPEARLIVFTPWISNGARNAEGTETTVYTQAIIDLCQRRGVSCYDASDAGQNGIHMDREDFRRKYCLRPTDRWHLNGAGQQLFAPVFGAWLEETLDNTVRFSDLLGASSSLQTAVDRLYERGVMRGTSQSLFSPAQAATRLTLAVTLYRLAGEPETGLLEFSDVSPEDPQLSAISWAASQGLLTGGDAFFPSRSLTRQELALAFYQYYTVIAGGEVLELAGLNRFSDRDQIDSAAVLPFGWTLAQGILDADTALYPQAAVSRGQLALALARLMSLL